MKLSGYYFYMNTNIKEDFQICIRVPLRTKRVFEIKQKALFIFFKGYSLKQIKPTSLEGDSPILNNNKVPTQEILTNQNRVKDTLKTFGDLKNK